MPFGGLCGETGPEDSCPDQSVYRRLWMTTVGWAAANLQNIYLRQALSLHIPLFPFQFAFVSPFPAFSPGSQFGSAFQRCPNPSG